MDVATLTDLFAGNREASWGIPTDSSEPPLIDMVRGLYCRAPRRKTPEEAAIEGKLHLVVRLTFANENASTWCRV